MNQTSTPESVCRGNRKLRETVITSVAFFVFVLLLLTCFRLLFLYDNKYNTKPLPLQDETILLTEKDFSQNRLNFLIDGWQFSTGTVPPAQWQDGLRLTYVGEFSDYRILSETGAPLGSGTYRLRLNYRGRDMLAALRLPELFTEYRVWWDNEQLVAGNGTAQFSVPLTGGAHTLTVAVTATQGYYAGMYFPGTIGTERSLLRAERIQSSFYGFAFLTPLVLGLFSLGLWKRADSHLRFHFGLMCLCFSLYISYYFVQLWQLPFARYWYPVEEISFYLLLYLAIEVSLEACALNRNRLGRLFRWLALLIPVVEITLFLLTGVWDFAATLHGVLQNVYRVGVFLCLMLCCTRLWRLPERENRLMLAGNAAFGIGLLFNLIDSNLFEPIYTLWQFEWCAMLCILLFAAVMILRNKKIIDENLRYRNGLEQMIEDRTTQLNCVLEERRAFFSDMAHDLKAPLHATQTFIGMIRRHSVGLDPQLIYYLDQVEQKQQDMSKRVQSLNALNAVDKLAAKPEPVEITALLQEIFRRHNPEAQVNEIHLQILFPESGATIFVQKEKLLLAFENILYNAFRFTPPLGTVTITTQLSDDRIRFVVRDTGCGIPPEELPLIFKRFYMGKNGQQSGSGLGLYIVKNIISEANGTVSAVSETGKGSAFTIELPVMTAVAQSNIVSPCR